jgi:hypothetical protein
MKLSGVSCEVSCCAFIFTGVEQRSQDVSFFSSCKEPKEQTHVDQVVPLIREVGLCHDGNRLSNLHLKSRLAGQSDHDGDDGLLESFSGGGGEGSGSIFELRERYTESVRCSSDHPSLLCASPGCHRVLLPSLNLDPKKQLERTAQFALIQFLKLSAALCLVGLPCVLS